jgi:hypothetical protein
MRTIREVLDLVRQAFLAAALGQATLDKAQTDARPAPH